MTDGAGQYKIVSLPPGVFTVTFSLTGFSSVRREGIELTTGFTATVDSRASSRRGRGNDHRLGRLADCRRPEREAPGRHDARRRGRAADRQDRRRSRDAHSGRAADERHRRRRGGHRAWAGRSAWTSSRRSPRTVAVPPTRASRSTASTSTSSVSGRTAPTPTSRTATSRSTRSRSRHTRPRAKPAACASTSSRRTAATRFSGQFFANYADDSFQSDNMTDELRATGLRDPDKTRVALDAQPVARRAARAGQAVVLRRLLAHGERALEGRHVLQHRSRRVAADVRHQPAGHGGREDPRRQHPPHVAGRGQAQGRFYYSQQPAVPVPVSHRRHLRRHQRARRRDDGAPHVEPRRR